MKNDYDLLNGLFSASKPTKGTPLAFEDTVEQILPTTKRTFKIFNEPWEDFLILAKLKGKTQAELINWLIETAVTENADDIEKYKSLLK